MFAARNAMVALGPYYYMAEHEPEPEVTAPKKEIDLLYQDGVFKFRNIKNYKYSKAWYPQLKEEQDVT